MRRIDLNPTAARSMSSIVERLRADAHKGATVPHGQKDMGATGNSFWLRPDGSSHSVRELDEGLGAAEGRIDEAVQDLIETGERLDAAETVVEDTAGRLTVVETETIPNAVSALEQADADARTELTELDGKLTSTQQDLGDVRTDLTAARDTADAAASAADAAQTTADDAAASALAAAGIAADKGRIYYQADAPTGADAESPNNLWIDSDDGAVYVWNGSTWEESQSEDLRDAAMAAVAAQQAADAADAKAQAAAEAAANAQAAAEAAQQTADDATLEARDAHNAAVAAQDQLDAKIASGDSLIINGSFESGALGWPSYIESNIHPRAGIVEDPDARTGTHTLRLTPVDSNTYPESTPLLAVTPGQVVNFRGWWKHLGGDGTMTRMLIRTHDAAGAYVNIQYVSVRTDVQEWPIGEWILQEGDYVVEDGIRFLSFAPHATGTSTSEYRVDDLQVIDVTDARAAQARAEEAYQEAASKATPAEVTAAADAAEAAAKTAAEADATAKADQAKADALAEAATDATSKAEAAEAAAKAAASLDAKEKADQALADALAALQAAQTDLEGQIVASANGKNSITIKGGAPTQDGVVAGDLYWQTATDGNIFAQFTWTGSAWKASTIRNEMMASLDVHKLQVTGSATISDLVVEKFWADGIAARSVTASKLTISGGDLLANGYFAGGDSAGWTGDSSLEVVPVVGPDALPSPYALKAPAGTPTVSPYSGADIPVEPGGEYVFEFWVIADKPNSRMYIEMRDQDGTLAVQSLRRTSPDNATGSSYLLSNQLIPTIWTKFQMSVTLRGTSRVLRLGNFYYNHTNGSERNAAVWMTGFSFRKAVGAVEIKDGAITTPKLTVTEAMTAKFADFMSVATKKLIVTDETILNHATLIGQTVVDDINVQGKLIGSDGVFTGTVDFANVNVTGDLLAAQISGEYLFGTEIEGGMFYTSDVGYGQVIMSDSAFTSPVDGSSGPGFTFVPGNPSRYNYMPGLGPIADGMQLSGGLGTDGRGYANFTDHGISMTWDSQNGGLQSNLAVYEGAITMSYYGDTGSGGLRVDNEGVWLSSPGATIRSRVNYVELTAQGSYVTVRNGQASLSSSSVLFNLSDLTGTGRLDGKLEVTGNIYGKGRIDVDGAFAIQGNGGISGDLYYYGGGTNSRSANLTMQSGGGIVSRSTSSRRYKKNIAEWNPDIERVLGLQPRQWQHDDPNSPIDETWRVGFVAEEVHDLGLYGLVEYAGDGAGGWRPEGLNYDRFAAAQQIVLKSHESRIKELEAEIERLLVDTEE